MDSHIDCVAKPDKELLGVMAEAKVKLAQAYRIK